MLVLGLMRGETMVMNTWKKVKIICIYPTPYMVAFHAKHISETTKFAGLHFFFFFAVTCNAVHGQKKERKSLQKAFCLKQ
jgi:hypothetical protein